MNTTPYWTAGSKKFPALEKDLSVDAVVVGGGMTGITTAYQLKRAGLSVALVERNRCMQGETGHTTAHLAAVTDRPFRELTRTFGADHAQAVWDAGFSAIAEINATVRREDIDCDFAWSEGYLHTSLDGDASGRTAEVEQLRAEAACVSDAGFDATFMESIPGLERPGIRFDHQAKFQPLKYAAALLALIDGHGSHVFEHSTVDEIKDGDPLTITVGAHTISTRFVIVATHVPMMGKTGLVKATLLQTDLYPYSSYAVRAKIRKHVLPDAMFWDTADPYYYLRVDAGSHNDFVIFGGADHKTGQVGDPRECFERVERKLLELVPDAEVTHRWSGQVIETRDGLPYLGEVAPRQFALTGFSGNGITFGTVGAMMARDAAVGLTNPWKDLFDINRTRVTKGLWNYLRENKDYPYYLIRDRFAGAEGKSTRAVKRGQGKILELDGEKVAVHRDEEGAVTQLSPYCTHMNCLVNWNAAESSWDCPCHGSRFTATGKLMAGPAETPLAVHLHHSPRQSHADTKETVDG